MTAYQYVAEDSRGARISGVYEEVPDRDGLREDLEKLGYRLLQCRRMSRRSPAEQVKKKIQQSEIVAFAYEFAGMFSAGLSVVRCLETMEEQAANEAMRTVLSTVRQSIETGASVAEAFEPYRSVFGDFFMGMLEAGQTGGKLSQTLATAANYYEKQLAVRNKIRGAFIYPAVVALLCACGPLAGPARADWTTIYGALREEARQVSSASLSVPLSPAQWEATVAQRREMFSDGPNVTARNRTRQAPGEAHLFDVVQSTDQYGHAGGQGIGLRYIEVLPQVSSQVHERVQIVAGDAHRGVVESLVLFTQLHVSAVQSVRETLEIAQDRLFSLERERRPGQVFQRLLDACECVTRMHASNMGAKVARRGKYGS